MIDTIFTVFFWSSALALAAPLLLAALGETVVQRAGMFNVGLEGMMLVGAFAGVAATIRCGGAVVGLVVAVAVGALVGLGYAVAVGWARADQVVIGIGFNLAAIGVTSLLRREWFGSGMTAADLGVLDDLRIPGLASIPFLGPVLFDQSPLVYLSYLVLPVVAWALAGTRAGLLIRAVGDGAAAADAHGVPVLRVRAAALAFGGATAGLAGAILALVQSGGVFVDNMAAGRGFLALALTIFARWIPWRVVVGAVAFGALDALQYRGQAEFENIPSSLFLMAPFLLALIAWVMLGDTRSAPRDLGKPFIRGAG
ncbi:nucleoside ABC transporter membrane protein [Frankia sp. EI5c]|uniref:ABC transporter permease n=1 Tax=Frankia sp. EI5c TaxID=683316 RepID=UPI0007C23F6A|nr:ABC transporter permease [Frankia sp. EI5c]OAA25383.1 nucleoside ABC transporter membrane protein [Frankia sp. EI5c]